MTRRTGILAALGLVLWLGLSGVSCQTPRKNSQVQVARQFLLHLLQKNYTAAYAQLAPDVREHLTEQAFRARAAPVTALGARRGTDIELYKLGARLPSDAAQQLELFVAFAWPADSASSRRLPTEWLEVTFPDTAARVVQGFQVRHK